MTTNTLTAMGTITAPPRIVRVPILPFGLLNAHLIIGEQGCLLVDTGLPGSHHKIGRVLKGHGRTFKDIKLIVVTHAHVDHAGTAAQMRQLSGAPILAHAADLDYFEQKEQMTFCETGWFGRLGVGAVGQRRHRGGRPGRLRHPAGRTGAHRACDPAAV